ncbi:MAG: Rho-binding antiterminator [Bacteroidota bacterium]
MNTYIPINCSYYDELEAAATQRRTVTIVYRDKQEQEQKVATRITDLFARNKEEFMVLENGLEFRLDRLVSIDGKMPPLVC